MKFVCAQPAIWYYHWQLDVMLHNFSRMGVPLRDVHCVMMKEQTFDVSLWGKLQEKYPEVTFAFYDDTRTNKSYISSLRPHILNKHFEEYPSLYTGAVFYHDCDIVLTRPIDFAPLLSDDIWYLSDTKSYIGAKYIQSKDYNILNEMCDIVGIPAETVINNEDNSGGAQYLIKDVPRGFWESVYKDSEELYRYFNQKAIEYTEPHHHPIQSWTADMWAMLWNIWKYGRTTRISNDLRFCWATDPIVKWSDCPIFHNAGVVSDSEGLFFKANHMIHPPDTLDLHDFTSTRCSYMYVQEIIACLGGKAV